MLGDSLTDSNRTIWALNQTALNSTLTGDPGLDRINEIVGNRGDLNRQTADWNTLRYHTSGLLAHI
jgi:hypothetical protein